MTGELTAVTAQSIIANAQQLGLTWTMRVATVESGENPKIVRATCDGDSESIIMQSTIGRIRPGARVFCVSVPPSLNYIIGYAEILTNDTRHVRVVSTHATSDLTLNTGSGVLVPGTELTVTTFFSDAVLHLTAVADANVNSFSTGGVAIGEIFVDGVAETQQLLWEMTAAGNRATIAQTYDITLTTPGDHTIGLYGRKSGGTNAIVFSGVHSGWTATVIDGP